MEHRRFSHRTLPTWTWRNSWSEIWNSKGQPIRKLYQWLTDSADIAEALSKKMSPDELTQCVPLIGKEVRRSARYPQRLCRATLRALKTEARRRWPQRFIRLNEVLY